MNERLYVMFCFSDSVGGGQNYVNTKVKWLKKREWDVLVFSAIEDFSGEYKTPWDALREYKKYRSEFLNQSPEYCGKVLTELTLNWMETCIGTSYNQIIIESHTDFFAEWGERLAERIGAKHICFLLDEQLEKYGAKQFLYWKYLRREVAGISESSIHRLFKDFYDVPISESYMLKATYDGEAQDYYVPQLESLQQTDYRIAYMGRDKQYSKNIIEGVKKFSISNKEKTILFLVMGKISGIKELQKIKNVQVLELGFLNPVPKSFFEKVDVVIAGAGCAMISASQGVYTIVADAGTCLSAGVLGYSADNPFFSTEQANPFEVELNKCLIDKVYDNMKYNYSPPYDVDIDFFMHLDFIKNSDDSKEYFDFEKLPQRNYSIKGKRDLYNRIMYFLFPHYSWNKAKKLRT